METPDGEYFCGFDMVACMHPQSLLVYELGGKPLTPGHGAPLRLAKPIKYGYKQIKQIGLIRYTDTCPMIIGPTLATIGMVACEGESRALRLVPLHQLDRGRSRSLTRHHNRLHRSLPVLSSCL
jgi:DMSO/TMAO reductase YedYZ molybdopterin-dependent catalytic subunit